MNQSKRIGRKQLAKYKHAGHTVEIYFLGPDLLVYVDGSELSPFYSNLDGARKGALRYINEIEKEKCNAAN